MKKLFQPLAFTFFAFMAILFSCQAQSDKTENTLLWKVEGPNIQPSYVYGTFHILPEDDFLLTDKVKTAFKSCDQLAMELDMDDPNLQTEMFKYIAMKDGNTLDKFLSPEELDTLNAWVQSATGMGIENMLTWKPFMVSTMIINRFIKGKTASFELVFTQMAMEAKKEIFGLESIQDQLSIFDKISYQEQADDLREMMKNEDAFKDLNEEMITLYQSEDIAGIYQIMESYLDGESEMELMLLERNRNWIPRIAELAKDKSTFIGVGAGHLGGEEGLVNLLKQAGYTLTPVK